MKTKTNKNLKSGLFTREELELYKVKEKWIVSILEYQEKLPILFDDECEEGNVDARNLYFYAGYQDEGKHFSTWIKRKLERVMAEENEDYTVHKIVEGSDTNGYGGLNKINYTLTLDCAKDIMMTEKGLLGKITRDYFKAMEFVAKCRMDWNFDRNQTLIKCVDLKSALSKYEESIIQTIPSWAYGNQYKAEFCLLNEVIIGMSATDYRNKNGLKKNHPIRNTFSEKQLEYVDELERYDADLLNVQYIFNYNKRKEILKRKLELIK